jgi:hypothetical protein
MNAAALGGAQRSVDFARKVGVLTQTQSEQLSRDMRHEVGATPKEAGDLTDQRKSKAPPASSKDS